MGTGVGGSGPSALEVEEARYRDMFRSKPIDYLEGYLAHYEKSVSESVEGALKGTLSKALHCEPLDIRIAREIHKEKCVPRYRESRDSEEIGTNWRT